LRSEEVRIMEKVYARTNAIKKDMVSGFCPGCMHGTVHKLIGEVLEDLDIVTAPPAFWAWAAAAWAWNT
jgi:pyruvate/2-oxoacid:ferredoxin oxidoreductase beta subunit